jgi:hypothetical protein
MSILPSGLPQVVEAIVANVEQVIASVEVEVAVIEAAVSGFIASI